MMRSTGSPSISGNNAAVRVGSVKLPNAFSMLTSPVGKVRLAVAVAEEKVPVVGVLPMLVGLPDCGTSFTVKTVPTGVLVAVRVTGTGLVVPDGKETSAVV